MLTPYSIRKAVNGLKDGQIELIESTILTQK